MSKEVTGTVISVKRQWWLKINTKPVRKHMWDGAIFPYIIKVRYTVDGQDYIKRKWIRAGHPVPEAGGNATVICCEDAPEKATIV